MAEFVSVPGLQSRARRPGALSDEAAAEPEDAPKPGLLTRIDETLDIAQIQTTAVRLVAATLIGTVAAFALIWLGTGTFWWALLALLIPLAVRSWVQWRLDRRRKAFAEQLPDMLQVISAALRSGQSFAGAFAVVVESSGEPMKSEMQRVVADEQLGIPLDKAMEVVSKRMDNRDLEQIALVAELQRESGGNAAEVVDSVADTVRGRFELRRLISTLTVQGRMSRWIVTALPIALVVIISLINPNYMHPLWVRTIGKVMIVLAVLLVIGGSLVIKKIVDIKV
jgi:tight adherence protein B